MQWYLCWCRWTTLSRESQYYRLRIAKPAGSAPSLQWRKISSPLRLGSPPSPANLQGLPSPRAFCSRATPERILHWYRQLSSAATRDLHGGAGIPRSKWPIRGPDLPSLRAVKTFGVCGYYPQEALKRALSSCRAPCGLNFPPIAWPPELPWVFFGYSSGGPSTWSKDAIIYTAESHFPATPSTQNYPGYSADPIRSYVCRSPWSFPEIERSREGERRNLRFQRERLALTRRGCQSEGLLCLCSPNILLFTQIIEIPRPSAIASVGEPNVRDIL